MQCHSRSLIPVKIIVEELCHFYLKQMRAMSRQVMSYYEKLTHKRCNYRHLVHWEERWIFFIRFDTVKVWKLFTQVLFLTSSNRRTCKQSARWSNLDLAKCMFCSSRIWLFALSIIIDNYKECYCCRNGQSSIRILLSETNLISIPHSNLQPWILDPTLFLAHFTRLTPHLTCHTITVDKLTIFFFRTGFGSRKMSVQCSHFRDIPHAARSLRGSKENKPILWCLSKLHCNYSNVLQ